MKKIMTVFNKCSVFSKGNSEFMNSVFYDELETLSHKIELIEILKL